MNTPVQEPQADFDPFSLPNITFQPLRTQRRMLLDIHTFPVRRCSCDKLKTNAQSDQLWGNLVDYATTVWNGVETKTCELSEPLIPSTILPFPCAEDQIDASSRLNSWYSSHSRSISRRVWMYRKISIQHQIQSILTSSVEVALQMRYSDTNVEVNQGSDWTDTNGAELPTDICFPNFARLRSSEQDARLLLISHLASGNDGNCLVVMIKDPQTLSDDAMRNLACGETPETYDQLVEISNECHYLNVDYGFLTNGSSILLFIRTDHDQLCFSGVKDWTDPDIFLAILGLCFISIDHPQDQNRIVKDYLCNPKVDYRVIWQPPKPTFDKLNEGFRYHRYYSTDFSNGSSGYLSQTDFEDLDTSDTSSEDGDDAYQ